MSVCFDYGLFFFLYRAPVDMEVRYVFAVNTCEVVLSVDMCKIENLNLKPCTDLT